MLSRDYTGLRIEVKIKYPKVPLEPVNAYQQEEITISGICVKSGFNDILDAWQVVVGRTPIWPVSDNDILILNQ